MSLMLNTPPGFGEIDGFCVSVDRDVECMNVGTWLYSVVVSDIKVSQSIPLYSPVQIHSQGLEQYPFLHPG